MIGTRGLGKPNSEKFCSHTRRKISQKRPQSQKSQKSLKKWKIGAITTETEVVETTTVLNFEEDKTAFDNSTSFYLHISENPYILPPPPPADRKSPKTPELPPIVVGCNPRKVGRYNLPPRSKPNIDPDFRILEAVTTDNAYPP